MKKHTLIMLGILTLSLCSAVGSVSALVEPSTSSQIIMAASFLETQQGRNALRIAGAVIFVVLITAIFAFIRNLYAKVSKLGKSYRQNSDSFHRRLNELERGLAMQKSSQNQLYQPQLQNNKDIEQRVKNLESEFSLLRNQLRHFQEAPPQPTQCHEPWQNFSSQLPEQVNLSLPSYMDQLVTLYNHNLPELTQRGVKVNVTPESAKRASTSLSFENIEFVEQGRLGTFVVIADNSSDQAYLFPIYSMPQALELQREIIRSLYEIPNSLRGSHEGALLQQPALVQQIDMGKWRLNERGKISSM